MGPVRRLAGISVLIEQTTIATSAPLKAPPVYA
jgi:hypothetical protein